MDEEKNIENKKKRGRPAGGGQKQRGGFGVGEVLENGFPRYGGAVAQLKWFRAEFLRNYDGGRGVTKERAEWLMRAYRATLELARLKVPKRGKGGEEAEYLEHLKEMEEEQRARLVDRDHIDS